MTKPSIFFAIFLFCFSFQASGADESNDFWLGTFTKKEIGKDLSVWTEAQMRFDLDQSNMQQVLFRTGLLRSLSDTSGLGLLYAYIESGEKSEHRLALQHTQKYGRFIGSRLSHRIRLEGRRFENIGTGSLRLRYLARAQFQTNGVLKPIFWNEVFLNSKREERTGARHFDRNRLFLGFRKNLKNVNVSLEFGYLNQFVPRALGDSFEHVLVFYLFL